MGICGSKGVKTFKLDSKSPEHQRIARNFSPEAIEILYLIFEDQAHRSEDDYVNKDVFLSFFPQTGLWGHRLFKKFDTHQTGNIDFTEFLTGLVPIVSKDMKLKTKKFFEMYDQDNNGYIDKEEFKKMQFNYPKEEINKITDDFNDEFAFMKNQNQYDSVANFKDIGFDYKPKAKYSQNDMSDDVNPKFQDPPNIQANQTSCMNGKVGLNGDNNLEEFKKKDGAIGDEDIAIKVEQDEQNVDKRPNRNMSLLISTYTVDNAITREKKIADVCAYRVKCTNINNRIKQYVDCVFSNYDSEKDDRQTFLDFKHWLSEHPKMMDTYEKTFEVQIWRKTKDPKTNKPIPSFRLKAPEFRCKCLVRHGKESQKKLWIEIHWKLLFVFKKEDDDIPIISKYLDLLTLEDKSDTKGHAIELSHHCTYYRSLKQTFDDEAHHQKFMQKVGYLQETSAKLLFDFVEKVGAGKFSTVYKTYKKDDGKANPDKVFAVKVIDKTTLTPEELELIHNETDIMKLLQYSSIIRYYETIAGKDFLYIVTEYVKDGDLFDHIVTNEFLEEEEASFITKQLLLSIEYLHNIDIIHRDLKPENILIEKDSKNRVSTIKLIDFGFACLEEDMEIGQVCGTPNYVAPEVLRGRCDHSADLFAAGVIVYLMIRGTLPFDDKIPDQIINKTMRGDYQITDTHWQNVSEDGRDLVQKLLNKDFKQRISVSEAQQHPWIKDRHKQKEMNGKNKKTR